VLIAELAVERDSSAPFCHGVPASMKADARGLQPAQDGGGHEFRPVVLQPTIVRAPTRDNRNPTLASDPSLT
jgi:hypothetical protein